MTKIIITKFISKDAKTFLRMKSRNYDRIYSKHMYRIILRLESASVR